VTTTTISWSKDAKGNLPASVDHANPNAGGDPISWTTQTGVETTVGWQVNIEIGVDDLGLKIGGEASGSETVDLSTGQSGTVEAPPAPPGCGKVNHDVELFGYEGWCIEKTKETYYTSGGYVTPEPDIDDYATREWTVLSYLITYKNSQENYGEDNYPRPDPYIKDWKETYWTPCLCWTNGQPATKIGTMAMLSPQVTRDWR